jgi:hypothetical protein
MPTTVSLIRNTAATLTALGLLALAGCGGGGGGGGSGSSSSSGGSGSSSSSSGGSSSGGTTTGSASLNWSVPTTNSDGSNLTDLAGFHIYYGTSPDQLSSQINVGGAATSYVVGNLAVGTWYFAMTAVNSAGVEGDLSNTASKSIN